MRATNPHRRRTLSSLRQLRHHRRHLIPVLPRLAGIGSGRAGLHPVQERLARAHGSQCGFCTPGFVMSMYSLLRSKTSAPSEEEIEENLAGNLWCAGGFLLQHAAATCSMRTIAAPITDLDSPRLHALYGGKKLG